MPPIHTRATPTHDAHPYTHPHMPQTHPVLQPALYSQSTPSCHCYCYTKPHGQPQHRVAVVQKQHGNRHHHVAVIQSHMEISTPTCCCCTEPHENPHHHDAVVQNHMEYIVRLLLYYRTTWKSTSSNCSYTNHMNINLHYQIALVQTAWKSISCRAWKSTQTPTQSKCHKITEAPGEFMEETKCSWPINRKTKQWANISLHAIQIRAWRNESQLHFCHCPAKTRAKATRNNKSGTK